MRVGLLLSLSGPAADFGTSERNGATVVLDQLNADGGVDGRTIEYVIADDKSDPTEATKQFRKLVTEEEVSVVIGPTVSASTLAIGSLAQSSEVPLLALNGTIAVTSKDNDFYPWIFRGAPSDLITAEKMFDQVVSEGHRRIAIYAEETGYGDDVLKYLESLVEEAKGEGVEIVVTTRSAADATDLSAQATKIRQADPDVVLVLANPPALGAALVRAIRQGSDVPVWGPMGLAQNTFLEAAGPAGEGLHAMALANWDNPSESEAELAELLEAEGFEPASFEVAGSNGAQAIEAALKKIGDGEVTGSSMRDALETICDVPTYSYGDGLCYSKDNHDGFGTDAVRMVVVEGGAFVDYRP